METPALLLLIATLLPLASFTLLVFMGKRMGNPLAGYVGTAAIAGGFACSLGALMLWVNGGAGWGFDVQPINLPIQWIPVGEGIGQDHEGFLDLGLYVDSLTVLMFVMVTLVATLIHIFSIGYMREDPRFERFFTYLSLFGFSMLGLVIGGTLLQLFVFWELVGLCSYLLIGFWYEKKSASNAAIKAFVVNRIGDFGFLIGLGILFYHLGNVSLPQVWALLDVSQMTERGVEYAPGLFIGAGLMTVMGMGLFFGAVGKSAQFPLHVWLPDAMEGPTPVSALIHAATMVAAGVYLVARIFPVLTPEARLFIAIIGATTLTMAALIAVAQTDIKKVLAYSTLSQLGYMILALGVGSWIGALFHLITHAFFKALLFLGSGSVIHAAHHEQEMTQYGGLWRKIPVTAVTFAIAVFAIAGVPYLSGYFSKDMILEHAASFSLIAGDRGLSRWYGALFVLPTTIAYVTAFYMTRCWMLTFWGKPRNQHLYDHAHEQPVMWGPLVVLAGLSIAGGWYVVPTLLSSAVRESEAIARQVAEPMGRDFNGFVAAWPAHPPDALREEVVEAPAAVIGAPMEAAQAHEQGYHLAHTWVMWAFVVGIGLGVLLYWDGFRFVNALFAIPVLGVVLGWIHTWLYRRMYFDELYMFVFVGITMGLSRFSAWFDAKVIDKLVDGAGALTRWASYLAGKNDQYVVDGAVNGAGRLTFGLGSMVRSPQTGRIRMYVTVLMISMALGIAGAIVVILSL
jgi:NADH-quinone oxidoreductase subunit L